MLSLFFIIFISITQVFLQEAILNETRWEKYIKKINDNLKFFEDCTQPDPLCICHESLMNEDLAAWTRTGITREMMEQTKRLGVHYQVINRQLYRQKECIFPARCKGIEHFILNFISELPDMEMVINTQDIPMSRKGSIKLPIMSFSKTKDFWDISYPAWSFWEGGPAVWPIYPTGLGRWDLMRKNLIQESKNHPWSQKKKLGFFRGSRTSEERDGLILLSRVQPKLVDAKYTKNQAWRSKEDTLGDEPAKEVPLEEHCQYKYLFNFRGVAASFRFRHLFLCGSLVFHVGEEWLEFFYPSLRPWIHYIPVSTDLSDLKELILFAKTNDKVAKEIADRGYIFMKNHMKMYDVACYWKKMLLRYSTLLKYRVSKADKMIRVNKVKDEL